jgi:hypothetical protein
MAFLVPPNLGKGASPTEGGTALDKAESFHAGKNSGTGGMGWRKPQEQPTLESRIEIDWYIIPPPKRLHTLFRAQPLHTPP